MKQSRKTTRAVLSFQNYSLFISSLDKEAYQSALTLYEALDTSVSLSMYLKLKYGEWRQIAESRVDPSQYTSSSAFEGDYQAVSYLSKYPYLDAGIDRQAVALESFRNAEEECLKTNRRIRQLIDRPLEVEGDVRTALWLASRKIQSILGDFDWEEFSRSTGWGPGATNVAKGRYTSGYNKFSGPLSSTNGNLSLGLCCVNSIPTWAHHVVEGNPDDFEPPRPVTVLPSAVQIVKGGEIIFVPKNAKTDRTITIPVSLNSYVQKGMGKMIRKRLKHAGVDLQDQTCNQQHALLGSLNNDRATVDAKSASDTIATELIRLLVPDEWFEALYRAREPYGLLKATNEWIYFQKFSAMGNSYTFELESLIFYAICEGCVELQRGREDCNLNKWTGTSFPDTVSVYGDDMIIPSDCYSLVLRVLNFAGFSINESKTYVEGLFRESCGKDYFHGKLVRPIFLKERLLNAEAVFKLANNVRRFAHRRFNNVGCDRRLYVVWSSLISLIPTHLRRLRISEGYGDGGLISNWDEARPPLARNGWEGWRVRMLQRSPVTESMHQYRAVMAVYLSSKSELPRRGEYDLRGSTSLKVATTIVREWYDLGPWV